MVAAASGVVSSALMIGWELCTRTASVPMCTNLPTLACFAAASTFFVPSTVTCLDNSAGVSGGALDHLSKDGPQPRLAGHVHADDFLQCSE